ncbi:MAG TPA: patatin-like phospholipase family protein [Acidimicrobiales bacterium]|nr:patatin-like phospholipase family protein [Acidimicrobiales bacterium]
MKRALILAGGGIRVAWQAGAVQALDEAGLRFDHGDGTSGGIFTLGMLLSGVEPAALGDRWRSLPVRRFVSFLPLRQYLRLPTSWPAFGSASGITDHVLPHLGIEVDRIRSATAMTGTFNVADFDAKTCVAIPNDDIDIDRLVAGVSLPIFLPAVPARGRTWTDAVWIKDANLMEAVRRGCNELWLLWCIGNTPYWGNGPLEQYVHMIELSANSALIGELEQIADINERRRRGEAVFGSTEEAVVHVVKPDLPLPLDPDFVTGRITAETLVAMGYRDAWRYVRARTEEGTALDGTATRMAVPPLGARVVLRMQGKVPLDQDLPPEAVTVSFVVEVTDIGRFAHDPVATASVVGGIDHPRWGYRPFVDATLRVGNDGDGVKRFSVSAAVRVEEDEPVFELGWSLRRGRGRWRDASRVSLAVRPSRGAPVGEHGSGRIGCRDAIRAVVAFEPSGAHDLRDRARAANLMVGFLRDR